MTIVPGERKKLRPALLMKNNAVRLCFIFWVWAGAISDLYGQEVAYTVFDRERGLESNYINDIARDDSGFFWLATDRGVVRFDGANFLNVSTVRKGAANIQRIKIIGELAYLIYYDLKGIDTLNIRTLASGHLLDGPVSDVALIDSENIAVYRTTGELIKLKNNKVRQVVRVDQAYDGLLKYWNGYLFLQLAGKKVICADPESFNIIREFKKPGFEFTRGGFQADSTGLIVSMINHVFGVNRNLEITNEQEALNQKFGVSHNLVSASPNLQYFIREGKELVTFDKGRLSEFIFPERGISELRTLFMVDSLNLLIGTNGGLIHYRNTPEDLMALNNQESLFAKRVRVRRNIIPISPDLTILTGYPGIIQWSDDRLSVVERFQGSYLSDAVKLGDKIYGVGESQSIFSWDFKNGKVETYEFIELSHSEQLTCIAADPEKNVLMMAGRGGLFSFDPKTKKFSRVAKMDTRSASRLVKTADGGWLAGTEYGLVHFDSEYKLRNTISVSTPGVKLLSDTINVITPAGGSTYWVGHQKGVQLLDIVRGEVADSIPAAWFSDSRIAGIIQDSLGRVWVSSFDGIVGYDPRTGVHIRLGGNSKLINREFNKRSEAVLSDGRIMFGGVSGFDLINPYDFKFSESKNRGIISAVIWFDEAGRVLKTILQDQSGEYRFNMEKESIRFMLSASNFPETTTEKFQFRFGADNWKDLTGRSFLDIYKLSPGSYTIEFRGIDRYGNIISFEPVKLRAEIVFYKSVTFIATVLSAFVLSLFLILLIIKRNQRHEFRIKESIAMDLHDEVGTTLTRALMVSRLPVAQRSDQKVQDYLSDALFSLRTYIRTMNKNFIPADQFFGDLQDTIHAALEHSGMRYHFSKNLTGRPEFTSAMCRDIKLVFFELLNNVLKHSGTADVYVNLKADERMCAIDFYDNGVLTETGNLKKSGFGLNNIEKRVARYGGTVQWTIAPGGKGLRVEMNFKNNGK